MCNVPNNHWRDGKRPLLRQINLKAVPSIGKLPVDLGIDREGNRLHRAIAHHKITSAGVRAAEVFVGTRRSQFHVSGGTCIAK